MATKRYDVVAVTGTYTDRQGNEKKRYMNCGVVLETDKGLSLKLEAMPVNSEGWFMLFEPREDGQRQGSNRPEQAQQEQDGGEFRDDIPFSPRHWMEG